MAFGDELSNGEYHTVVVEIFSNGSIQLYLDCTSNDDCFIYEAITDPSASFSTITPFYIGGIEVDSHESLYHLTTTISFVGSISNFSINGDMLNLLPNTNSAVRSRNVLVGHQRINQCENQPCMNSGQCIDLWFNYQCKCSLAYSGQNCDFLFLANFDHNSFLHIEYAAPIMSLSLQFSTLNEDGILLSIGNVSI